MGKYMRKSKTTGDVGVVDLTLGVLTRAKALALQRRSPPYLLRSRDAPTPNLNLARANNRAPPRPRGKCGPGRAEETEEEVAKRTGAGQDQGDDDLGVEEGSFGENGLKIDSRDRNSRESTPSNLVKDPESTQSPGSSTRPVSSTDVERRLQSQRRIPSPGVLDEFFARAEEKQRQAFIQKYNFDPLEEKPLPGRFEWEKVEP